MTLTVTQEGRILSFSHDSSKAITVTIESDQGDRETVELHPSTAVAWAAPDGWRSARIYAPDFEPDFETEARFAPDPELQSDDPARVHLARVRELRHDLAVAIAGRCALRLLPLYELSVPSPQPVVRDAAFRTLLGKDSDFLYDELRLDHITRTLVDGDLKAAADAVTAIRHAASAANAKRLGSARTASELAVFSIRVAFRLGDSMIEAVGADVDRASSAACTANQLRERDLWPPFVKRPPWADPRYDYINALPDVEFADGDDVEEFDHPALEIYVDPGDASEDDLVELYSALNALNMVYGGQGYEFSEDTCEAFAVEEERT